MKLQRTVSASPINTDQDSLRRSQLFLNSRGQSLEMTRPHTSQRSQSTSRSLTGMSESAHREARRRQTESEQKQQNLSRMIIKKTLLKRLSDTGPPLVSRMTTIQPDTRSASGTSHGSRVTRPAHRTSHCHSPPHSLYSRIYPETSRRRKCRSSTPQLSLSSPSQSGSVSCLNMPTCPPHPKTWHLWQSLRRAYLYSRIKYETQGHLQTFQ